MTEFKAGDRVRIVGNADPDYLDDYTGHTGTVREAYPEDGFVQVALDGEPDHLICEFDSEEVEKIG